MPFRQALSQASQSERTPCWKSFVREQLAQALQLDSAVIGSRTPLQDLGLDSLTGLELRNRSESGWG